MNWTEIDDGLKIIVDTREQNPFFFRAQLHLPNAKIERGKLDAGDYSITSAGEEEVAFERKGTLCEFVGCLFDERFWREMARLKFYDWKGVYVVGTVGDIRKEKYKKKFPRYITGADGRKVRMADKICFEKVSPQVVLSKKSQIFAENGIPVFMFDNQDDMELTMYEDLRWIHRVIEAKRQNGA